MSFIGLLVVIEGKRRSGVLIGVEVGVPLGLPFDIDDLFIQTLFLAGFDFRSSAIQNIIDDVVVFGVGMFRLGFIIFAVEVVVSNDKIVFFDLVMFDGLIGLVMKVV